MFIELKLDAEDRAARRARVNRFDLRAEVIRLLAELDRLGNGTIERIDIRYGIPRRMIVEARPQGVVAMTRPSPPQRRCRSLCFRQASLCASHLVRRGRFAVDDWDDLRQEMFLDLLRDCRDSVRSGVTGMDSFAGSCGTDRRRWRLMSGGAFCTFRTRQAGMTVMMMGKISRSSVPTGRLPASSFRRICWQLTRGGIHDEGGSRGSAEFPPGHRGNRLLFRPDFQCRAAPDRGRALVNFAGKVFASRTTLFARRANGRTIRSTAANSRLNRWGMTWKWMRTGWRISWPTIPM